MIICIHIWGEKKRKHWKLTGFTGKAVKLISLKKVDIRFQHLSWVGSMHANSLHLCPTLCDPMDYSPPDSSVHGDSPGNTGVGMPSSRGSSWPRGWTCIPYISCTGRRVLYQDCHLGRTTSLMSSGSESLCSSPPKLCLPLLPLRVACLDFFFPENDTVREQRVSW